MEVFRIAKTAHIRDLSGTGARLYGGRWNQKGVAVVYTSESRALATVEFLVHVPIAIVPKDLSLARLSIPGNVAEEEVTTGDLPTRWRSHPAIPELAEIGRKWVESNSALLLRVPSAVVKDERNVLINPSHPEISLVEIVDVERCEFDPRLLRQRGG